MSRLKKILVALPEDTICRLDSMSAKKGMNRSELLRSIIAEYLCDAEKTELYEQLKRGYQMMADINLEEAEFALQADNSQLDIYERKLSECE